MLRAVIASSKMNSAGLLRRRDLIVRSVAAAAAAPVAAVTTRFHTLAQDAEGSSIPEAPAGQNAFEFIATVHQVGFDFSFYGYLTRVAGIVPSLLFTNTDPTNRGPSDARLTIFGTVSASSRSILEQVFDVNGEGTLGLYLAETGGASFEDPDSFQSGVPVASGLVRIQSVVTVIAPQSGLTHGYGDLSFDTSEPFVIGDARFHFRTGEPVLRLSYNGQGTLLDPELPESMLYVAGNTSSVS